MIPDAYWVTNSTLDLVDNTGWKKLQSTCYGQAQILVNTSTSDPIFQHRLQRLLPEDGPQSLASVISSPPPPSLPWASPDNYKLSGPLISLAHLSSYSSSNPPRITFGSVLQILLSDCTDSD